MRNEVTSAPSKFTKNYISQNLLECQEQFQKTAWVLSESMREADTINNYVEGRHYSFATLQELKKARRSPEAYNLILRMKRLLTGYFKKVVTTAVAQAVTPQDTETANLHNEHFKLAKRLTNWGVFSSAVTSDLIMTGQGAWTIVVTPTGRKDNLDRPINDISFKHIPSRQVLVDTRATYPDKRDARHVHYWEYLSYEEIVNEFGTTWANKIEMTHADIDEVESYTISQNELYHNLNDFEHWREGRTYVIVRTYRRDLEGNISLTSWHGDFELSSKLLDVKILPIQAISLQNMTDTNRYYSPMYEACMSQDSINQALLAFQKLVGEKRVIASNKAIHSDDVAAFQRKLNTISEVLHVKSLEGIKIEQLTGEATAHLNKMYTSIQLIMQVIGINEAFLGESKAGDSGRKFEGQRSASENTLDYIFTPINLMYETMFKQCVHYTSLYKQATEQLRFVDDFGKSRWQTVNQPFIMPTGEVDPDGVPVVEFVEKEFYNHTTKRWEKGFVNEHSKSLSDIALEVEVHSAPYDDTDATELAFIEGMLNGQLGAMMANADPAGLPYLYSLLAKNLKTRNSEKVGMYLAKLAEKLGIFDVEDPRLYNSPSQGATQQSGGNAVTAGAGNAGSQGAIKYAGGTTNDTQPDGYNQPTGVK